MEIGDTAVVASAARQRWNDTHVTLEKDAQYALSATGEWIDWKTRCGPAGYPSPNFLLSERARRAPSEPWFALIGALDHDRSTQFTIGTSCGYQPTRTAELTCFANDLSLAYCNNKGEVTLTIHRIA